MKKEDPHGRQGERLGINEPVCLVPAPTPNRDDVERLKRDWEADPIWELEDTPGFEAYRDELLAHSQRIKQQREAEWAAQLAKAAGVMGVPADSPLFKYLRGLEYRIEQLQGQIDYLQKQIDNRHSL